MPPLGGASMLQAIVLVALFVQDPQAAGSARVKQTAFARIPLARTIASDAELRAAVDAKNATGETMNEIKRRDQEWIRNPKDPRRQELVSNACATRLRSLVATDAIIVEAFLMDQHGALVCSTAETSDYWQGD